MILVPGSSPVVIDVGILFSFHFRVSGIDFIH